MHTQRCVRRQASSNPDCSEAELELVARIREPMVLRQDPKNSSQQDWVPSVWYTIEYTSRASPMPDVNEVSFVSFGV
jgi:hypothetical protein